MRQIQAFYSLLDRKAKKYDLITHSKFESSGGGHIHVGIPRNLTAFGLFHFLLNLQTDLSNRPYLNYLFNENCDERNSFHPLQFKNCNYTLRKPPVVSNVGELQHYWLDAMRRLISERGWNSTSPSLVINGDTTCKDIDRYTKRSKGNYREVIGSIISLFGGQDTYMRLNRDFYTIEFRIFDMVRNGIDLSNHVNFLNNYLHYVCDLTQKGEIIKPCFKRNNAKTRIRVCDSFRDPYKTRTEFKKLLMVLNLKWGDYKIYYSRNYLSRLKLGYKFN